MNTLYWLAVGALIKLFRSGKVVGALIGVGVLKGMNEYGMCKTNNLCN